ncbi:MAG: hypothetical protein WCS94_10530, partial [Verrucomicrobiota bacterium]
GPRRIDRVVLHCSSAKNYPIDYRIQVSHDGGVTVNDIAVVKNQAAPSRNDLAMEIRFPPVLCDNVRIFIERSATTTKVDCAQLAEIEIFGYDSTNAPAATSAKNKQLPQHILKPGDDKDLTVEESLESITITSPWQKLILDKRQPVVRFLAWDSAGQRRLALNLLQKEGLRLRVEPAYGKAWEPALVTLARQGNVFRYSPVIVADGVAMTWELRIGAKTVDFALARYATRSFAAKPGMLRLAFDAGQTPVLPYYKPGDNGFAELPCLLHAADAGQALFVSPDKSVSGFAWRARDYGVPQAPWVNLDVAAESPKRPDGLVVIKPGLWQGLISWNVECVNPLASLIVTNSRLKNVGLARFMLNGMPFRPDSGLLANSATSINCAFCLFEYADMAAFLPQLPGNIDATDLLRASFDRYVEGVWGHDVSCDGIFDSGYKTPVDTKPALLIAAWTVVRKTGDLKLLHRWIPAIEKLAALMEETDADGDGILETVKSTHSGGWYDVIQNKGKCAYGNALAYRAFGYAADLERLAGNPKQAEQYAQVAERIRRAYLPTFLNPATGIICGWRTKDGAYHDYWFPWINGMAISLGLVPEPQANVIVDRIQTKFKQVGFDRFALGMPNCLEPIARADYVKNDNGEQINPFKVYLNGGVSPCYCYHYIQALYRLGRRAEADFILWPMLKQFDSGRFNGGAENKRSPSINLATGAPCPPNREWSNWDGSPQTGEGFLPDCYHVLNVLWTGYYGITFGAKGYQLEPWSPLAGRLPQLGLKYMGKNQ